MDEGAQEGGGLKSKNLASGGGEGMSRELQRRKNKRQDGMSEFVSPRLFVQKEPSRGWN